MILQGWKFAHRVSEQILVFLWKNERMSDLLKITSDSLIHSFLVMESLMVAHGWSFLVSNLSNSLTSLTKNEGISDSLIF